MHLRITLAAAAAVCLLALAACGNAAPAPAAGAPAPGWLHYQARAQQDTAACMTRAGWRYVPGQPPDPNSYPVLLAERQAFGFFLFAPYAEPQNAAVRQHDLVPGTDDLAAPGNPDAAVIAALPAARLAAYDTALYGAGQEGGGRSGGCLLAGQEAAGPPPQPTGTYITQVQASYRAAISAALGSYSSCLSRAGYAVPADPQLLLQAVFDDEQVALRTALRHGHLTAAAARAGMAREVTAALTDLRCGRTWYQLHDSEVNQMYATVSPW